MALHTSVSLERLEDALSKTVNTDVYHLSMATDFWKAVRAVSRRPPHNKVPRADTLLFCPELPGRAGEAMSWVVAANPALSHSSHAAVSSPSMPSA